MSVDFANGNRATLGDPGGESRRVAMFPCRLLVRALVWGNASLVPRFRQLFGWMGLSICVHPTIWDKAADAPLPRYSFWNSFGAPLESSLAAMSLVYSGLFDRHPDARIMFTQGGGWIHFGVGRLDLRYKTRPDARPMARPPAEYLRQMYYDCLVHDDDALALLVKRAGADRIMVGTDFPAGGDILGGAVRWIEQSGHLSDADKSKILLGNAQRFLGLTKR